MSNELRSRATIHDMFTGLIEDVGTVYRWRRGKGGGTLTVITGLPVGELAVGSSIAVNGACLTVVGKQRDRFTVEVSPETLSRTNLRSVRLGDVVNLERPIRLMDRLGGHLVTGHVDGVGVIEEIKKKGRFTFFLFRVPAALHPHLVQKGSIAVDGISLTINDCKKPCFSVAVIPFTLEHTNLRQCRVGDKVNIETDIIGKYVHRLLTSGRLDGDATGRPKKHRSKKE